MNRRRRAMAASYGAPQSGGGGGGSPVYENDFNDGWIEEFTEEVYTNDMESD